MSAEFSNLDTVKRTACRTKGTVLEGWSIIPAAGELRQ